MRGADGCEEDQPQHRLRRDEVRQRQHHGATEHRSEHPRVAAAQGLLQVAAKHHRHAQNQPVRMRCPRQGERQKICGAQRQRRAHRVPKHRRLRRHLCTQRFQRPAFGRHEALQLFAREEHLFLVAVQQGVDAGDVGADVAQPIEDRRQQPCSRIVVRDGRVGEGVAQIVLLWRERRRRRSVSKRVSGRVERLADLPKPKRHRLQNPPSGGVAAQAVQIEPTGQQHIAQIDGTQQDGGVAAGPFGVGLGEDEVAGGLKLLGEFGFAGDPRLHRECVGRLRRFEQRGARLQ